VAVPSHIRCAILRAIRPGNAIILLPRPLNLNSLHHQGYTSLGKQSDTEPNPLLLRPDASGGYLPAYELKDWSAERAGRDKNNKRDGASATKGSNSASSSAPATGAAVEARLISGKDEQSGCDMKNESSSLS